MFVYCRNDACWSIFNHGVGQTRALSFYATLKIMFLKLLCFFPTFIELKYCRGPIQLRLGAICYKIIGSSFVPVCFYCKFRVRACIHVLIWVPYLRFKAYTLNIRIACYTFHCAFFSWQEDSHTSINCPGQTHSHISIAWEKPAHFLLTFMFDSFFFIIFFLPIGWLHTLLFIQGWNIWWYSKAHVSPWVSKTRASQANYASSILKCFPIYYADL
jgi:hypothetical protein